MSSIDQFVERVKQKYQEDNMSGGANTSKSTTRRSKTPAKARKTPAKRQTKSKTPARRQTKSKTPARKTNSTSSRKTRKTPSMMRGGSKQSEELMMGGCGCEMKMKPVQQPMMSGGGMEIYTVDEEDENKSLTTIVNESKKQYIVVELSIEDAKVIGTYLVLKNNWSTGDNIKYLSGDVKQQYGYNKISL